MQQKNTKKAPVKKATASKPATAAPTIKANKAEAVFNIDEINELLKAFTKSNVNELKLQKGDFKISINQGGSNNKTTYVQSQPAQVIQHSPAHNAPISAPSPAAPTPTTEAPVVGEVLAQNNYITIKSPMIGTFYRSPGPGKPPFVSVGDDISVGSVLCVVEAMKLFNEIESEVSGKIVKVLIDDTSPVEYDQPLFLVEPN